jgi:transcriptional regulator with XRE-family HTH domain
MESKGIDINDLSVAVGVNRKTVWMWLKGDSKPNLKYQSRIAKMFDRQVSDFKIEKVTTAYKNFINKEVFMKFDGNKLLMAINMRADELEVKPSDIKKQIRNELNVTAQTITNWVKGYNPPTMTHIAYLSKVLDIQEPLFTLFKEEENK